MKYKNAILKYCFLAFITLCIWMVLYPEYTYNEDIVCKLDVCGGKMLPFSYAEFMETDMDQVRVKSRLFTFLNGTKNMKEE